MSELKPCPNCGRKKLWSVRIFPLRWIFTRYYIECPSCHWCGETKIGKRRAKRAWNRRVENERRIIMESNANKAQTVDVDKAMAFVEEYAFKDDKEVYTNGSILVPLFRVKQAFVDKAYNGLFES